MNKDKPNVLIVCPGIGHINRGFESFTNECFNALRSSKNFNLILLKGGGKSVGENEKRILCLQRRGKFAQLLYKITGREAYWFEQASFLLGMLPSLIKNKPAVIFYSDFVLGTFLWHLRRFFKFKYKLLFSNGAPNGPPFSTMHHVQQLLEFYQTDAVTKGTPAEMQTLLPYGFDIDINERLSTLAQKQQVRQTLGFSPQQKVIISVGAINKHHKRMHYLINEVAKLPSEYYLVILGQFEEDTPELQNLALQKLPNRHLIANVTFDEVKKYYTAADHFALASLIEGFGRVLVEALSYGLPCFVHDYVNARQVLQQYGNYVDMEHEGDLAASLLNYTSKFSAEELIEASYNLYSWDKLKVDYDGMICKLMN